MKVAFVSQPLDGQYPPPTNSISILVREFARQLVPELEVTVFTASRTDRRTCTVDGGVRYEHLPLALDRLAERVLRRLSRGGDPLRPYYASLLSAPSFAWQVAREARRRRFDIVHVMNNSQFVPWIRRLHPGAKIVLHMHCEWLSQLDAGLLAPRLAEVDRILGCSDYVVDKVRQRFPAFADRCRTLHNGVDVDRFAPASPASSAGPAGARRILFVGRLSPEKGVHVLVEAFARVAREVPEARLELVGSFGSVPAEYVMDVTDDPLTRDLSAHCGDQGDAYARRLQDVVAGHGLADRVDFRGSVANDELPDLLASADLFVFPSVWEEPFGIPPVEAMAAGVPVVATRAGGISETVVDGETGLLVERGDPEALARAMTTLLADPAQAREMGARGRERAVRCFAYPVVAARLRSLYRGLGPDAAEDEAR